MRVVICGAGQVGYGIAERLAAEQNDVAIIDISPKLIAAVSDSLDVRGFVGHGAHPDVLVQAGIEQADMLIAVTLYDEVNMIACQIAHALFNVPTKVARIRAQNYLEPHWRDLFSQEHLPIDVIISPEVEVGEMVLRRLAIPGAVESISFANDAVSAVAIACEDDCPVLDTPLRQLTDLFPDLKAVVVGVRRNGRVFVPRSHDALLAGDLAVVVSHADQVRRTLSIFGHEETPAQRVIIAGGGNIGLFVTRELERRNPKTKIKIVETSRDRAIAIADQLERSVVLHGSALDREILEEADVTDADTLVAVTNDDQVNILSCVLGKRLGAKRNLALLNNSSYPPFARDLGIDAHVSPRQITVSRILHHVRRGRIRSVYALMDGQAEVIEAEALETSPLVGRPLREVHLDEGMRIGAIYRGGRVLMPNGDSMIQAHDRLIMFALPDKIRQVEQLFRVSLDFF